jgi:thioredoxin-like negative regulator of GroEL
MVSIDYDRSPAAVQDFRVERLPTMLLLDHEGRLLVRVEGAGKEGFDALLQRIRNHGKAQRKQPGRK